MSVYDEITNGEIDAESPWTAAVTFKNRDNPLAIFEGDATARTALKGVAIDYNGQSAIFTDETDTSLVLHPDGVDGAEWSDLSSTVGQGELKTAQGIVTQSSGSANLTMAGGEYGFYPQVGDSTGGDPSVTAQIASVRTNNESQWTNIYLTDVGDDGGVVRAWQRYITASPPYDLGDGEISLFMFVHIKDGEIFSTYLAEAPPWAYNGPTKIRPDKWEVDKRTGKIDTKHIKMNELSIAVESWKRKRALKLEIPLDEDVMKFTRDKRQLMRSNKVYAPIDQERKNRDMDIIAHPFVDAKDVSEIFILDPPAMGELAEAQQDGYNISALLSNGYIEMQNDTINRKTPEGVTPVKFRWKNT